MPNRGALRKIAISLAREIIEIIYCAFQNRILNKRTQFAVYLRLNPERVNLRDFLIGEAIMIAQREKNGG